MPSELVITTVEHLGVAGLALIGWWLERKDRQKLQRRVDSLEDKLNDCLRHQRK